MVSPAAAGRRRSSTMEGATAGSRRIFSKTRALSIKIIVSARKNKSMSENNRNVRLDRTFLLNLFVLVKQGVYLLYK
jgi:hypothetical protein